MRDTKRIPKVLKEIENIWMKHPDLRLGQLLLNVLQDPALYYVEDDELLEMMKNVYN